MLTLLGVLICYLHPPLRLHFDISSVLIHLVVPTVCCMTPFSHILSILLVCYGKLNSEWIHFYFMVNWSLPPFPFNKCRLLHWICPLLLKEESAVMKAWSCQRGVKLLCIEERKDLRGKKETRADRTVERLQRGYYKLPRVLCYTSSDSCSPQVFHATRGSHFFPFNIGRLKRKVMNCTVNWSHKWKKSLVCVL